MLCFNNYYLFQLVVFFSTKPLLCVIRPLFDSGTSVYYRLYIKFKLSHNPNFQLFCLQWSLYSISTMVLRRFVKVIAPSQTVALMSTVIEVLTKYQNVLGVLRRMTNGKQKDDCVITMKMITYLTITSGGGFSMQHKGNDV